MDDLSLFVAQNQRPTVSVPGATVFFWPFPSAVAPNVLDWRAAVDMGRGKPIYANFKVTTTFAETGGAAENSLHFCVAVTDDAGLAEVALNRALVLAQGPEVLTSGLVAFVSPLTPGLVVSLALPPLNTLAIPDPIIGAPTTNPLGDTGKRYLGLGFRAVVPNNDWIAGGVDAWFSDHPVTVRRPAYTVGA